MEIKERKTKQKMIFAIPLLLLLFSFFLSISIGRFSLSLSGIIEVLSGGGTQMERSVFWELRVPRTILVMASGMALSVSGTALQKLFLNPLASPDIIGVTSGCSVGAAFGIVFLGGSAFAVQSSSFVGGLLAMAFAVILTGMLRTNKTVGFILAGIATGALSTAFIMILKYLADPLYQLSSVDFWLMGGFYTADWKQVCLVVPITLIGILVLYLISWQLQVLSYGQEQAAALGIPIKVLRMIVLFITTLMTAAVVSASGLISWIGLISPHIAKLCQKGESRHHMMLSALIGAGLLLIADTLAKSLTANEIPVSIVTTLIGVPVLLWLTRKMKKQQFIE